MRKRITCLMTVFGFVLGMSGYLAAWPDATGWDVLAAVFRKPDNNTHRALALRALVRLAGDRTAKPDAALIAMGYWWLLIVGVLFVFRLFVDSMMVRRPLLEPNLNASGRRWVS